MANVFGQELKRWRLCRGRTQLDLALLAGYSQRHVSFLESGRSQPSRATVVILADALDVPIRSRNKLLHAAGFAPLYTSEPLDSERLAPALAALEIVVAGHRPFPAVIVDRAWNLLGGNVNAFALFELFVHRPLQPAPSMPLNAMQLCLDADGLRPSMSNWHRFMAAILVHLRQERDYGGPRPDLDELIGRIEDDAEFRAHGREAAGAVDTPVQTLTLERDGLGVRLFTMLSTFGTAHDTSLAELRVETFFPADSESRRVLEDIDQRAAQDGVSAPATQVAWRRAG